MKMKVIWSPEVRAQQEWIVDRNNPDWTVSYPVETATGWGWLEFIQRLDGMSSVAWRALLWALRRADEHRLPLESIEINWADLDLRLLCVVCQEWAVPKGHECVLPDVEESADEAAGDEGKKAGDTNPEE